VDRTRLARTLGSWLVPGRDRRDWPQLPNEAVPAFWHRFDKTRRVCVISERSAKLYRNGVQIVVCVCVVGLAPQALDQLFARDHLSWPLQQHDQHTEGKFLDFDPSPLIKQDAVARKDLEKAKAIVRGHRQIDMKLRSQEAILNPQGEIDLPIALRDRRCARFNRLTGMGLSLRKVYRKSPVDNWQRAAFSQPIR
jgi:hypothetical protein